MKITSRYNLYYTSIAKPQKCSFSQVWKKIPDLKYLLLSFRHKTVINIFAIWCEEKKILILQPFSSLLAQRSLEKVKGVASSSSSHISADDDLYGVIQVKYGFQKIFLGSSWSSIEVWSYQNPSYLNLITSKINQTRRYSFGKIVL